MKKDSIVSVSGFGHITHNFTIIPSSIRRATIGSELFQIFSTLINKWDGRTMCRKKISIIGFAFNSKAGSHLLSLYLPLHFQEHILHSITAHPIKLLICNFYFIFSLLSRCFILMTMGLFPVSRFGIKLISNWIFLCCCFSSFFFLLFFYSVSGENAICGNLLTGVI